MIITDESKIRKECKDVSLLEAHDIISSLEKELKLSEHVGIGLAANQIGIDAKVCIIRTHKESLNLVNPYIVEQLDKALFKYEGCLSFPGELVTTARFSEIVVKDLLHPSGIVCTDLMAVVIQHEVGHLYGKTMHDYKVKEPAGPNMPCWCGSGIKYKKCHMGQEIRIV